jgi:hypothetical protein
MSKTRDTGFINNILKYDNSGNVSVVSGSTTLLFISSSGAIITTGIISGSNALSASYAVSASNSLAAQTASYVLNAQSASYVLNAQSASYVLTAQTASFVANAQSASNAVAAQTASFANAFTVAGTLTAQTLVVQTITSSVDFVTGSTRFGSILGNTHVFSGSVTMNPNGLFVSSSGVVGIGTTSPTTTLDVNGTGRFSSTLETTSGGTERHIRMLGYNSSYVSLRTNTGFNSSYNAFNVIVNSNSNDTGQGNTSIPSWEMVLGGNLPNQDSFYIGRSSAGSFTMTTLFKLSSTGAATFASSIGASSAGISSTSISTTPSTTLSTSRGIMVDAATTTNNAFVPIGFSWASSVSTYDPTWGMALKTVSYNAGTADLVFYTAGNVRMTIGNGGGTSFTGGVTATQLTANADNSGVIADVAGRHGLMKYFNYGTGLVGRNTETDGSISTWLGRFSGSITSPTNVFQDLVITNGGRIGIGIIGPRQRLDTSGAIRASSGGVNGDVIASAYGRTLYKVIISSNYDAGNNVRAAEWNILTNNEGTAITNVTQVYVFNGQSATFSISGGNLIVNDLSAGNNQIGVFTN